MSVAMQVSSQIGSRLRALRRERGHSLTRVAEGTGISRSFLVLVEGGKSDITITKLMRLAQFYGVPISDVLPDPAEAGSALVRRGEAQRVHSPDEGLDVLVLSRHAGRAMSPVLAYVEPGGVSERSSHEGEEFLHVLVGRIELRFIDGESIVLEEGDSAHFRAERPHEYRNVGDERAAMMSVVTPAIF
jgi:quercetin dioxygenase-like cupin family protein/DNA-binding XRE family transcriptional regulator